MNQSIMQANALLQYQGNEWATAAWIKASEYYRDDPHGYKADKFANEVVKITSVAWPLIQKHMANFKFVKEADGHAKAHDLMAHILKRHWHYRHPDSKK